MTVKEFIERCVMSDNERVCVIVKEADDELMISADLEYITDLIKAGDERMNLKIFKWSPSIFKRHDDADYPEITVWVEK